MAGEFKCLRSGRCCTAWGVEGVPGYSGDGAWTGNLADRGRKPELQPCRHLKPAQIIEGVWQPAACMIHDTDLYPDECRQFEIGFGPCAIGKEMWRIRRTKHPDASLPQDAEEALQT